MSDELARLRAIRDERSRPTVPTGPIYPPPADPLPDAEIDRQAVLNRAAGMTSDARSLYLLCGIAPGEDSNRPTFDY